MEKRILIVDDEVDTCNLLSGYLKRKGYETLTAFSGAKALEELSHSNVDLVVSDFRLGDTDGMELLTKINSRGNNQGGTQMHLTLTSRSFSPGSRFM